MSTQSTNVRFTSLAILILLILLSVSSTAAAPLLASPGDVIINEIMQNPSSVSDSDGEWLELYNPTSSAIDIEGWTVRDDGTDSFIINNGGPLLVQASGYLVLGNNSDLATNGGVNVDYEFSGMFIGNDYDEIVLLDSDSLEIDRVEYDNGVTFPDPNGASMALVDPALDNNVGENWCEASTLYGDGDFGTPGAENDCSVPPPPPPLVPIYDIQYTTDPSGDSPYKDQIDITTEGVVTAIFYNGYFIGDPAGGAWNGLWVYDPNTPALGDRVRLTGTVIEYNNLTELTDLTYYEVQSSGNPLPAAAILATVNVSQEQWEGLLVRVENVTVTNDDLGYGEWSVSDGSGDVVIDDKGSYTYSPANGDALAAVIGPLDYAHGAFKIQPRDDDDIIPAVVIPTYTPIYDIQYTTDPSGDSPYKDQIDITTEGVVTAIFYNGYFIGDPAGGAWNGLWVYDPNTPALGDRVRLTGTVIEYNNLTELTDLTYYEVQSSGNPLPAAAILATVNVSQEQWEGLLVRVENVTVTNDDLGYGEWSVSDGSGDVVIDDKGSYTYSPANGDALAAVIGPLDYAHGAFKIQPRDDDDIILPVPLPDIIINELDADQVSTDSAEFVELYDGGIGNTDLTGLVLVLINGSDDASYLAFDLDGQSTNGEGYFVLCGNATTVANCDMDVSPDTNLIQNGADAVALYVGDADDFPNDTPATTDNLVDAIVYDTDDGDDAGLLVLLNVGQPQVNERGGGDGTAHSNQRCPNGSGGVRNTDTYIQVEPTPGGKNGCPVPEIIINEVDADQVSTDSAEFVELYDGGVGNTSLDELVLVLFNGSDDASYLAFDLDGQSTNGEGYFVLCGNATTVANCDMDVSPDTNLIQNGADAVALYVGDDVEFPNDTPVTTDNLLDAIVYDTNDSDDSGLLLLLNPGQPQVNEDGAEDKDHYSNQRCPDGSGGPRYTDTYSSQFEPTPGEANACFGACGHPATTFINKVQGSGTESPLNGISDVIVEGVVVGDFQDTSTQLRGFFLQEEDIDADSDPSTSEGLFIYDYGFMDVNVGDVVRVKGSITEYWGLTEMNYITAMAVCGTGTASASIVSLPVSTLDVWEQYEGMLVTFPQTLYVTGNYYQGRYGEVDLSAFNRLDNPTNVLLPGPASLALQNLNDRSRLQLEDGSTIQNPLPAPYMGVGNTLRAGDTLPSLTGVLHYSFEAYELHPTEPVEFTRENDRPLDPPTVGGELKVASFNVLNYFTTIDDSGPICGPAGVMDCRGADSEDEFARQKTKIVNAILALDADVVGLMEIENHPDDNAVQDLVNGLNDMAGSGTYAYVATGPMGTDAIKVALIYKPAYVTPEGDFAVLDSSVDPTFIDTKNRPVLLQTFEENASGESFSVAVNHLKSKGSSCASIGDPEDPYGQGNCNQTRMDATVALANWLATDPTGSGDPDFLIIGDLNAYAMEDPVTALREAGYTDLLQPDPGERSYSYVFAGQAGYLDHGLANATLAAQVTGAAVWHINADEPAALDYNDYNQPDLYTDGVYKASDHDPVVVGLSLIPQCAELNATVYVNRDGLIVGGPFDGRSYKHMIRGTSGADVMVGTEGSDYLFGFQGDDVMCGLGGNDVLNGREGDDVLYAGSGNDVLIGWKGNDILYGGDGHDVLVAFFGDDLLYAGEGRDVLNGGQGYDMCDGGDDRDHAVHCEVTTNIP